MGLTKEEKKAIAALKRLEKSWPKSLWLYSASGSLNVMQCNEEGKQAHLSTAENGYEATDPAFSICVINIPNDGGDW